jgi:hypothetical protein
MIRLAMILLCLYAGDALAAERIDVSNKTCDQIKAILQARGRVLFELPSTRVPGLTRYGLYVDGQRSCRAPEVASLRRLRSTTGTCFVYQCGDNGRAQDR